MSKIVKETRALLVDDGATARNPNTTYNQTAQFKLPSAAQNVKIKRIYAYLTMIDSSDDHSEDFDARAWCFLRLTSASIRTTGLTNSVDIRIPITKHPLDCDLPITNDLIFDVYYGVQPTSINTQLTTIHVMFEIEYEIPGFSKR